MDQQTKNVFQEGSAKTEELLEFFRYMAYYDMRYWLQEALISLNISPPYNDADYKQLAKRLEGWMRDNKIAYHIKELATVTNKVKHINKFRKRQNKNPMVFSISMFGALTLADKMLWSARAFGNNVRGEVSLEELSKNLVDPKKLIFNPEKL